MRAARFLLIPVALALCSFCYANVRTGKVKAERGLPAWIQEEKPSIRQVIDRLGEPYRYREARGKVFLTYTDFRFPDSRLPERPLSRLSPPRGGQREWIPAELLIRFAWGVCSPSDLRALCVLCG